MAISESPSGWKTATTKKFAAGAEMNCKLELDVDARTAKLTINGVEMKCAFSETMTGVNYIGFGVKGATTLFTEPVIHD